MTPDTMDKIARSTSILLHSTGIPRPDNAVMVEKFSAFLTNEEASGAVTPSHDRILELSWNVVRDIAIDNITKTEDIPRPILLKIKGVDGMVADEELLLLPILLVRTLMQLWIADPPEEFISSSEKIIEGVRASFLERLKRLDPDKIIDGFDLAMFFRQVQPYMDARFRRVNAQPTSEGQAFAE